MKDVIGESGQWAVIILSVGAAIGAAFIELFARYRPVLGEWVRAEPALLSMRFSTRPGRGGRTLSWTTDRYCDLPIDGEGGNWRLKNGDSPVRERQPSGRRRVWLPEESHI